MTRLKTLSFEMNKLLTFSFAEVNIYKDSDLGMLIFKKNLNTRNFE